MSPGPGDSGNPLGLNQVWGLWSSPGPSEYGPHLDLVNMLHLGLIWSSCLWYLRGHHRNMVPLHGLQVGLSWTWSLWTLPGHHRDTVPLHGLQVGLTWN